MQQDPDTRNQNIKISKNNQAQDNELSQALFNPAQGHNDSKGSSILQEPLLTARSGAASARGGVHDRSQLLQEKRDRRKEGNKNRVGYQDEYQTASSNPTIDQEDLQGTLAEEKRKYEEIMARLDKFKHEKEFDNNEEEQADPDRPVAIEGLVDNRQRINTQGRLNQMMEKEHDRPASNYNNRYSTQEGIKRDHLSRHEDSIGEFNDEEDFKLSTDQQQSVTHLGAASQSSRPRPQEQKKSSENYMQDRINMQAGIGPAPSKAFGEGLRMESNQSRNHLPASSIDYSNENSVLEQSR